MKHTVDTTAIDHWLYKMVDAGGSDLIITANARPRVRVDGDLVPIEGEPALEPEQCTQMIMGMLNEDLQAQLIAEREIDLAFAWRDQVRFRANVFHQQGELAVALRLIPGRVPTMAELGLPTAIESFCVLPQGLVLVTGPTGSGKSTTLAAMIDAINEHRPCHILTIEDPIEYVHNHKLSLVNHREVGVDTETFDRALRAALREDPDVILVGELRDTETIAFALTAAETGHLVFATMHTNDASQAIDRVIDVFPVERQSQVRVQLAAVLNGVIAQRLVPRIGGGMVAAFEVLLAGSAIRNVIREGKTHQLRNLLAQGAREGMQTLERSLTDLVAAGVISYDDAIARAVYPRDVRAPGMAA
jgi:twitching motility protein PilT